MFVQRTHIRRPLNLLCSYFLSLVLLLHTTRFRMISYGSQSWKELATRKNKCDASFLSVRVGLELCYCGASSRVVRAMDEINRVLSDGTRDDS